MFDTAGRLDLYSLICHLLSFDTARGTDLLLRISPEARQRLPMAKGFALATLPFHVETGQDANLLGTMPDELGEAGFTELFHERLHYWQLLGYPPFQVRFLYLLERLRREIEDLGGKTYTVAGATAGHHSSNREPLEIFWERLNRQLSVTEPPQIHRLDDPREGGLCQLEKGIVGTRPGTETPYAGMQFRLPNAGGTVRVPFDAVHLVESAVSISEALSDHKAVPRGEDCQSEDELVYWGCWFYWHEVYAESGVDERILMQLFLAAVDLALMGDCAIVHDAEFYQNGADFERLFDEIAVSNRFAAITALPLPDNLPSEMGKNSALALVAYQLYAAEQLGWADPVETSGAQMLRLTRILAAFLWQPGSEGKQAAERILSLPVKRWREALNDCRIIWDEISERIHAFDLGFIGYRTLSMMLNYSASRINFPAEHIAPHEHFYQILSRFPLPLINFDGWYYKDFAVAMDDIYLNHPIRFSPAEIAVDCIQLSALMPLALHGEGSRCGLIDEVTGTPHCFYVAMGLGCPHPTVKPTEEELKIRQKYNLQDFCHWTFATLKVGVAPDSVERYWTTRWQQSN